MCERDDVPSPDRKEAINALRRDCAQSLKALTIAASTLALRAALQAIARSRPHTIDETTETGDLLRRQAELVQGAVDKYLQSTRKTAHLENTSAGS